MKSGDYSWQKNFNFSKFVKDNWHLTNFCRVFNSGFLFFKQRRKIIVGIAVILLFQAAIFITFSSFVFSTSADEFCAVDVDAVLIIDTSGSMYGGGAPSYCKWWVFQKIGSSYQWFLNTTYNVSEEWCQARDLPPPHNSIYTPPTPIKINAAKEAAKSFVLNLGPNDQSALVSFNTEATLVKVLSNDHASTTAAIDGLTLQGLTNIGDAILEGIKELGSERGNPQANKAMILLTDGKANRPNGPSFYENSADVLYAEQKAQQAADLGYKIFTIGLGSESEINEVMLQNIADITGAKYYHAPSSNDLSSIYNEIAWDVCQYGSISGCKYNDSNNDNDIEGEETLAGWEIILSGDAELTQLTDEEGCYTFAGLLDGEYTVSEGPNLEKQLYVQTYPLNNFYNITLSQGENVIDKDFGNYFPICGNNILDDDLDEECDDGNTEDGDGCSSVCLIEEEPEPEPYCGDGILDDGEECDDGNTEDGDGCSSVCLIEQEPEPEPYCGDGILDDGEECDDGNTEDGDGCSSVCLIEQEPEPEPYCGDGILDDGEECDDGNTEDGDGCSSVCMIEQEPEPEPVCGNGILEGEEECDDGNTEDGDGCSSVCLIEQEPEPEPYCGDGNLDDGEECDDGNNQDGDGCSALCLIEQEPEPEPYCGDGNVDDGEECDNGENNGNMCIPEYGSDCNYCSLECEIVTIDGPRCGDEILDDGEECDDGNNQDGDGCSSVCLIEQEPEPEPYCGDGNLDDGEECDDGNNQDGDGCSSVCLIEQEPEPYCGDNNLDNGEECDDGNTEDGDGCSSVCLIEAEPGPEPYCGDGNLDDGEECDDGNTEDGDGCSAVCIIEDGGDSEPQCTDADQDGYYQEGGDCGPIDCNDENPNVNPGATEICDNDLDDNCDGNVDGNDSNCQPTVTGGGGTGYIPEELIIEGTEIVVVDGNTVKIVWRTPKKANSRVIYDTQPGVFNPDSPPNYGYAFSTPEINTPPATNGVIYHEVFLENLIPGTNYYFRCISMASPEVISEEFSFTTLQVEQEETEEETTEETEGTGEGEETEGAEPESEETEETEGGETFLPEEEEEKIILSEEPEEETPGQGITVEAEEESAEEKITFQEETEPKTLLASLVSLIGGISWIVWLIIIIILCLVLLIFVIFKKKKKEENE